jgi:hypothetical protein
LFYILVFSSLEIDLSYRERIAAQHILKKAVMVFEKTYMGIQIPSGIGFGRGRFLYLALENNFNFEVCAENYTP